LMTAAQKRVLISSTVCETEFNLKSVAGTQSGHYVYLSIQRNFLRRRCLLDFKQMAVFWVVAPCRLVCVYQRLIVLIMEAVQTSKTMANSYRSAWRYTPGDSHLHSHRRENLKSYQVSNCFHFQLFLVVQNFRHYFHSNFQTVLLNFTSLNKKIMYLCVITQF
jgi:hypothetical protein